MIKGGKYMKKVKIWNNTIAVLTLLLVLFFSLSQPILAAEGESQPANNLDGRRPYIYRVDFGAGNRIQNQLSLDSNRISTDIDYSQDYNTIKLTIKHHKDDKDKIVLSEGTLHGIELFALGNTEYLIDFESMGKPQDILNRGDGESTIFLKTKGLSPNTEYNLRIGEGLVSLTINKDPNDPSNTTTLFSPAINIQFKTRTFPQVDSIITGSVSENYNEREPIIIKGKDFNNIVTVYFNDIPAYDVDIIEEGTTGNSYLKVYLPRGRNRLGTGVYDITVSNGKGHETILLSAFSVTKAGEYLPNEIERLKSQLRIGNIMEAIGTSDTTLNLSSRYADTTNLQIDSDEIFGQATLIRRIKYTAYKEDVINRLEIKSMWADIGFSYIRPISNDRKSNIEIITGRPDPYTTQLLREKLKGIKIKSEFINISGSGYSTSSINISIPYKDSDGTNLKVLRYDNITRRWEEEYFYVDEIENRVNIFANNQGIFVAVEY